MFRFVRQMEGDLSGQSKLGEVGWSCLRRLLVEFFCSSSFERMNRSNLLVAQSLLVTAGGVGLLEGFERPKFTTFLYGFALGSKVGVFGV